MLQEKPQPSEAQTEGAPAVLQTLLSFSNRILEYFEKVNGPSEESEALESMIKKSTTLESILASTVDIFESLIYVIESKFLDGGFKRKEYDNIPAESIDFTADYINLERLVQKHEKEIRRHIQVENQLKIFCEGLQQKIEDTEKEKEQFRESLMFANQTNAYLEKKLTTRDQENSVLRQRFQTLEIANTLLEEKVNKSKQDEKEKMKIRQDANKSKGRPEGESLNLQRALTMIKNQNKIESPTKMNLTQGPLNYRKKSPIPSSINNKSPYIPKNNPLQDFLRSKLEVFGTENRKNANTPESKRPLRRRVVSQNNSLGDAQKLDVSLEREKSCSAKPGFKRKKIPDLNKSLTKGNETKSLLEDHWLKYKRLLDNNK